MEFWGVEVKSGEKLVVDPGRDTYVHLSQASLGEVKKDNEHELVQLYVESNDRKIVLGTLSLENIPQTSFDLVFERQFNLSHNWKNGSVYFCGYRAHKGESDDESSDSDIGEDHFLNAVGPKKQENLAKPATETATTSKHGQKVKILDLNRTEDESSSDFGDESNETDSSKDQDIGIGGDESEEDTEDDGSSDDDEETPKKAAPTNKRPLESATKTPVPDKKSKVTTPQNIDGKKGGRPATPHPSKQVAKTAANNNQGKKQTQTSTNSFPCGSCNRSFKSEQALRSHSKDKHGISM